jgi:hypothetical protein
MTVSGTPDRSLRLFGDRLKLRLKEMSRLPELIPENAPGGGMAENADHRLLHLRAGEPLCTGARAVYTRAA